MPNRSHTPVPPAPSASNTESNTEQTKAEALQEAHEKGRTRAQRWAKLDPAIAQLRPLAAWRAIGYADAVLAFEDSPFLAELMRSWEAGFDSAVDVPATLAAAAPELSVEPVKSAAPAVAEEAEPAANLYYKNEDRAAYELGHLMQQLPVDFGVAPAVEAKHVQIATAAEQHAHLAGNTILGGIEAIGQLMQLAGANDDEAVSHHALYNLGDLLRHLAVEGQYLREVSDSLAHATAVYGQRREEGARKEVRHA
jgi:hypothetical protein